MDSSLDQVGLMPSLMWNWSTFWSACHHCRAHCLLKRATTAHPSIRFRVLDRSDLLVQSVVLFLIPALIVSRTPLLTDNLSFQFTFNSRPAAANFQRSSKEQSRPDKEQYKYTVIICNNTNSVCQYCHIKVFYTSMFILSCTCWL